jgi:hypothetical protein
MGIRRWFRDRMVGDEAEGDDLPPNGALVNAAWKREPERVHALGEYDQDTYPEELAEIVRRREQVTDELLQMDVTDRDGRVAAIPRLSQLLRTYPHPLAYELLIHAYVDAGRFDEAKGVAFAAQARRMECERSPHPEIRGEIDRLNEWSPEDIDQIRAEREARQK